MWHSRTWTDDGRAVTRTLIIPMYREHGRISRSVERLAGSMLDAPDVEMVFVDDGSDDGTFAAVEALCDEHDLRALIIRLPENRGKGAAIAAGVAVARGAAVVFTDADLSTSVADIAACFTTIEAGHVDIVVASRAHAESVIESDGPLRRQLIGRGYNRLLRALGLTSLRDTQCGLKGFRREVAVLLFGDLKVPGFGFDIEVLAKAERHGWRIEELPVQWEYVAQSRVRPVRDSVRMCRDALAVRRAVRAPSAAPIDLRDPVTAESATSP